jgi:hypothetical protein
MGGACLRGHRHPWLAGGPRRAVARRRWQGQLADQPDPARPYARSKFLRAGGDADADALRHSYRQEQPDPVANADADADALRLGIADANTVALRVAESMPIAYRHGDAVTIAER